MLSSTVVPPTSDHVPCTNRATILSKRGRPRTISRHASAGTTVRVCLEIYPCLTFPRGLGAYDSPLGVIIPLLRNDFHHPNAGFDKAVTGARHSSRVSICVFWQGRPGSYQIGGQVGRCRTCFHQCLSSDLATLLVASCETAKLRDVVGVVDVLEGNRCATFLVHRVPAGSKQPRCLVNARTLFMLCSH